MFFEDSMEQTWEMQTKPNANNVSAAKSSLHTSLKEFHKSVSRHSIQNIVKSRNLDKALKTAPTRNSRNNAGVVFMLTHVVLKDLS